MAEEGHRHAGAPRAAGAADAVHVVLRHARRVVVHHQVDARHVDAARGDVGRHQHAHAAVAHAVQRPRALLLVHVAVQRADGEAFLREPDGQLRRRALHAGEDQRLRDIGLAQEPIQHAHLVLVAVGDERVLRDVELRLRARLDLDPLRALRHAAGELADHAGERRREEERLAVLRHAREDRVELLLEAHVEHAVGLVQHQELDARESHAAAVEVILEAARRGDGDVERLPHLRELQPEGHAAHQ